MAPCGAILVADSDPAIVDFIVEALAEDGYAAVGVTDGAAATAAILTQPPNLVLIDLRFGAMEGMDVIQAVRAWGVDIPMVIMTTEQPNVAALEQHNVAAYLRKPFDLDDLLGCIANCMPRQQIPPESTA
jgi:DNA-binding response OmpR family regulator